MNWTRSRECEKSSHDFFYLFYPISSFSVREREEFCVVVVAALLLGEERKKVQNSGSVKWEKKKDGKQKQELNDDTVKWQLGRQGWKFRREFEMFSLMIRKEKSLFAGHWKTFWILSSPSFVLTLTHFSPPHATLLWAFDFISSSKNPRRCEKKF